MSERLADGRMFVGGRWTDAEGGRTIRVVDPADEELVAEVAYGGRVEAERAIDAAARAFADWRRRTTWDRAGYLRRAAEAMRSRADALARTLTLEQGKPLAEAKGEILHSADAFDWFAEEGKRAYGRTVPSPVASKRLVVMKHPLGVVGTITPWNFPAALPARKIAAALAAGCTVVSRPADQTPLTLVGMFECLEEAGLPDGVANLVIGEPREVADAYFAREEIRKVSFTGSTAVGKELIRRAADQVKKLSLELGGHAPLIVFPDADVEAVARLAVLGKFRNNGQVCIAPSRFYVHAAVEGEFGEAAVALARGLRIGPGVGAGVQVGPMIERRFVENAERLIADAKGRGAVIMTGAQRPAEFPRGHFFEPTVLGGVSEEMMVMNEEPFAPIMPLSGFRDLEKVIGAANRTRYGLAAYVFTRDIGIATRMAEELEAGIIGINESVPTSIPAPFGGMKESGWGRELGMEGLESFFETKLVSIGL